MFIVAASNMFAINATDDEDSESDVERCVKFLSSPSLNLMTTVTPEIMEIPEGALLLLLMRMSI